MLTCLFITVRLALHLFLNVQLLTRQVISKLARRYIMMGDATVVIHTMANPGGELGAMFASTMPPSPTMAPMAGMAGHMMASSG